MCTPPTKSYKFVSANPCETDAGRINKYDYTGCIGGSFWNSIRFRDFPETLQNLSVIFAHARCHLSCQERLWHSVMFSSKTKSVSSKTKPLCQGLPCQGSWRVSARLRGWTKDAFRVSGITQVLLCTTSPSSSLTRCHSCQERLWHSVTFFSKRKSVSSKTKPLCQGLPYQGSWRRRRLRGWTKDAFRVSGITQVLLCTTSPSSSLTLDATSPSRGGFGIPSRFPAKPNQFHRKRNLFAKGSPVRKDSPGRGRRHASAERGTAVERMRD